MYFLRSIRFLLFPLSWLYGMILHIRHFLYRLQIKKTTSFEKPIICIGNLNLGGSGKTPMIEYLIRLLQDSYSVAVLSRGYKRKEKKWVLAAADSTVDQLGDEPFQIYRKYPRTAVVVFPDRVYAFEQLQKHSPCQVTLLDDALQHRKIQAGFTILLTPFHCIYPDDHLLPWGNLRDLPQRARVADVIVVTKCPNDISWESKQKIIQKIRPLSHQSVFFSFISYSSSVRNHREEISVEDYISEPFCLVTGIADARPLVNYLKGRGARFTHWEFADHHRFSSQEIERLQQQPRLLTTEKDFARLGTLLPHLYYIPIEMQFSCVEQRQFNTMIINYLQ